MRILYVVHQFYPKFYTGTEKFALNIAKQIQRSGHYVEVLAYGLKEEKDSSINDKIMCKRYVFRGISVISIRHPSIPEGLNFDIFNDNFGSILNKIITKEKFDIVHMAHPMRLGDAMKAARSAGIPIVLTLTDFWLMCPRTILVTQKGQLCCGPKKGLKCIEECYRNTSKDRIIHRFNEAEKYINNADVLVSPTYFLAGLLKNTFDREINIIRHGIDYSAIKYNTKLNHKEHITFGYIGTVLPHKGVHIMAKAFKLLKNRNIKLKIYGNYFDEQEYYHSLKNLIEGDNRIELLGEYKDEELNAIMNGVDCIIAPSIWWENSPLTVLTSLAYKIPVITINAGGAAEPVKDGINGFNFEIGNPESLAKIIEKIVENPEMFNKIKDNIIRPTRVEEEAFKYEKIYSKLIS